MIQPDAFRAAPYDEEYIENQCYERPVENDQCSYELYANSTFLYAETKIAGLTQKECQSYCSHETRFYCQGVSFHFDGDLDRSQCLLHSEDIISMGPRSLKLRENSVYMRRVKCLDGKKIIWFNFYWLNRIQIYKFLFLFSSSSVYPKRNVYTLYTERLVPGQNVR